MQSYRYSDGTTGAARQVPNGGQVYPASYLARRAAETEPEWIARIGVLGVQPVRYETWPGDINSQYKGNAEVTKVDGWLVIGYPVLDKTPVWSTTSRERMYIMPGADVPPGYTELEPEDGAYSTWDGAAWAYDTDQRAADERDERDRRLTLSDWTQLPDSPLDEADKALWAAHRQELRDVPAQAGFPMDINWPESPE